MTLVALVALAAPRGLGRTGGAFLIALYVVFVDDSPRARLGRPAAPSTLGGMALFRRSAGDDPAPAIPTRRPHPGVLRRERRALLRARDERLRDLGGLTVEMYRRGAWRDDLLHERCAEVIGIDARLAEIDELLHGSEGTALHLRRAGAARLALLPELRPAARRAAATPVLDDTVVEPPRRAAGLDGASGGRWRSPPRRPCPRCGAAREPDQAYCLECGLRLPVVVGTVAVAPAALGARRSAGTRATGSGSRSRALVVAAAGAAAAIALGRKHAAARAGRPYVAPAPQASHAPTAATGRERPHALAARASTAGRSCSSPSPATHGRAKPLALAAGAARRGLPQVGVLDSSAFASLHPGYYVVFSGVYGAAGDAQIALETVRARGFGGAYVLRVAP